MSSSVLFHRPEGTGHLRHSWVLGKAPDKEARDAVFTISLIVSCMEDSECICRAAGSLATCHLPLSVWRCKSGSQN